MKNIENFGGACTSVVYILHLNVIDDSYSNKIGCMAPYGAVFAIETRDRTLEASQVVQTNGKVQLLNTLRDSFQGSDFLSHTLFVCLGLPKHRNRLTENVCCVFEVRVHVLSQPLYSLWVQRSSVCTRCHIGK